jgi:hypothetical protein
VLNWQGEIRMQYWQDIDGDKSQLVVVTNEAVYAESLQAALAEQQIARLRAGESPATVFGKDATHVVLRTVKRVQQSSSDSDIDFVSGEGKHANTQSIDIEDAGVRDAVFGEIEQVTQGRLRRYEDTYNRPRAAFGSLTALAAIGFITKVCIDAAMVIQAEGYEVEGRKRGFKQMVVWALDFLGPWGVGIIGGLLGALALFTLVQRIKSPPHLQILQAKPYRPQGVIVTGVKYALLIAACVVFEPVMLR